jgi:hypothetical protein
VHSATESGDSREQGALAVQSELAAVSVAEADEVRHKTASVLELARDEHCAGGRLEVSEQADPKMGQHLEHA